MGRGLHFLYLLIVFKEVKKMAVTCRMPGLRTGCGGHIKAWLPIKDSWNGLICFRFCHILDITR